MSNTRLVMAQRAHDLANSSDRQAARYREQRDRAIREIWENERESWTYAKLAARIGCSPELIAHIVKNK